MRANAGPGRLLTASDVGSLGLDAEEPPSPECPYCGAPLEPLAVELDGRAYWVSHRDCGCEGGGRFANDERPRSAANGGGSCWAG